MENSVEKNYNFFKNNFKSLFEQHAYKFLIIKDAEVISVFDTFDDAIKHASEKYEMGTFLVQHCVDSLTSAAHTFHSYQFVE